MTGSQDRELRWQGCSNVRDLGGLPVKGDRRTAWGAVVRSDHPNRLSKPGWLALEAHGIRSIVSLISDGVDLGPQTLAWYPEGLSTTDVAIEDASDPQFAQRWVRTGLWGTPLYWQDALSRWPDRHSAAIAAVAHARPGGVLVHCGRGHDRTGIVTCLLLALIGVEPADIALDYEMSNANMPLKDRVALRDCLAREQTTAREAIFDLLTNFDLESCLRGGGLEDRDLVALRTRLLE